MSPPAIPRERISVYIPAFNVAEYLQRCIEGLLAQSLPPDEFPIIDDGSWDNSAEIASNFRAVTLIRHPANKGLAATRNTALHATRNELVASLDADCVAAPAILGVGGKFIEGVQLSTADRWRAVLMPQHWGNTPICNPKFLFGNNNLFCKSAALELRGYDENLRTNGEDADLSDRLRRKKLTLLYDPQRVQTTSAMIRRFLF